MLNSLYGDVTLALPSADQAAQIDAAFANVHADQSNVEKNYTSDTPKPVFSYFAENSPVLRNLIVGTVLIC